MLSTTLAPAARSRKIFEDRQTFAPRTYLLLTNVVISVISWEVFYWCCKLRDSTFDFPKNYEIIDFSF